MLEKLKGFMNKPVLGAQGMSGRYRVLWDDEHISKGMLAAHLNPNWDAATRNHTFVCESVDWIAGLVPSHQYVNLLDLGCGPGLYAERFAQAGYRVTGLDFSRRSITYAIEQTTRTGSGIKYYFQNYLEMDYMEKFDIITLIYCDYAVLSVSDRIKLLQKVYKALKPNGKFIFDVFTPKMRQQERHSWKYYENGGFYCAEPHLLLEAVYQYDDADETELSQYIVIRDEEATCYVCPNHFFTRESLDSETGFIGFRSLVFYGDVAGKRYSETGETICCVFTK